MENMLSPFHSLWQGSQKGKGSSSRAQYNKCCSRWPYASVPFPQRALSSPSFLSPLLHRTDGNGYCLLSCFLVSHQGANSDSARNSTYCYPHMLRERIRCLAFIAAAHFTSGAIGVTCVTMSCQQSVLSLRQCWHWVILF